VSKKFIITIVYQIFNSLLVLLAKARSNAENVGAYLRGRLK